MLKLSNNSNIDIIVILKAHYQNSAPVFTGMKNAHSVSWFSHHSYYDSLGEINQESLMAPFEEHTSHALMRRAAIATISTLYLRGVFINILNNRCCL